MRVAIRRAAALLALTLASTSVGLAAGPVSAANGCRDTSQSCVRITVVSTKGFKVETKVVRYLTAQEIGTMADLKLPEYYTRTKAGAPEERKPNPSRALTLRKLLDQVDPEVAGDVTFSEATFAGESPRVLDKPAFGDDSGTAFPYYKNTSPSVYALSNGTIGYYRPLTDKNDVNGSDLFTVDGRLDFTIHTTGKLLEPTATVSNSAPTTKEASKFSVDPRGDKGMKFEYRWEFGDDRGPGRKDKSPSHRYVKKGEYDAYVTVRGADGSYGRSAVLPIKVAKPPPKPKPMPSTGGGTGGGFTGGTGGYVPPYTPPTTNFPEPDPIDEPFDDEPTEDVPVDDGLVDVEGYVLAGAEIVPGGTPEAIPGTQASADPTPASTTSVRKRLATWTVAAFAIVLLVGAGAASETRWFRNRLRHFRRRA